VFQLICSESVFLNGAFHWLVKIATRGIRHLTFHLTTEKSQEQTLPVDPQSVKTLEVLGGSLCFSAYRPEARGIDFWVMKEETSWSRLCTVPTSFQRVVFSTDGQKILMYVIVLFKILNTTILQQLWSWFAGCRIVMNLLCLVS
jgi:hypothetical protein